MGRKKVSEEQKRKTIRNAVNKYHKEKMKVFSFRFSLVNQTDIIEHLESQTNKTGYVADLIRKDLIAQGKQPFVRQRLCDVAKEINDEDEIILVFKDGSKMSVSKEDLINDERYIDSVEIIQCLLNDKYIIKVRYS